jgi:uncharacterized membrane protein YraQ (UPF0718 family)
MTVHVVYPTTLLLFFASLVVVLLGLVDIRRGFLLPGYGPANPWVNLNPHHLWWLTLGVAGLMIAYYHLRRSEARREVDEKQLESLTKLTLFALFGLLMVDTLLLYRGVAATGIVEAGKMGIGALGLAPGQLPGRAEVVSLASTPPLLRPVAVTVNYLALVWHATFLALLWAGLGAVALPLYVGWLISPRGSSRFRSLLGGVAYAVPQPFCSCCAAPIAATMYKKGASLVSSVAFLLSSPTLNITSLILAATLLPLPFAALRIIGGGLLVVFTTYVVTNFAGRLPLEETPASPPGGIAGFVSRAFNRYSMLFQFEPEGGMVRSPAELIRSWLSSTWRIAKVVIPTLAGGGVVAGIIVTFVPTVFRNDVAGILLASGLGTIFMIATWTEIPVAAILAAQGLTGPAAALLMTLPVVSLPCLIIFGGALRSGRVPLLLGLITFVFGTLAGLLFL